MEWLLAAIIGTVVGTLFSFAARGVHMPQALCILLGLIGGIVGAGLAAASGAESFGRWTWYLASAITAVGLVAGGMLAFTLTSGERRA